MKEIEVKILEVNRPQIEQTLSRLGAKKILDDEILTLFFDFEDRRIVNAKNVLRLRVEQDKTELTYKKVHITQTTKTAEEYSVDVSSLETMKRILENLGLCTTESLQKHRVSYSLDGARFDFDCYLGDYSYIPEFLEIEAENSDLIYRYAVQLGFEAEDCLPWSTTELIKHYESKKGQQQSKHF
jgi:predicted adenylyl cyclase CyaB